MRWRTEEDGTDGKEGHKYCEFTIRFRKRVRLYARLELEGAWTMSKIRFCVTVSGIICVSGGF